MQRSSKLSPPNQTRSSSDAEKPARRDIIRRDEKYRQLVGRRTAASYAEGVLVNRQVVGWYSIFRPNFF